MVQLNRIYTKSGDKGRTSLGDGSRVDKHHLRIDVMGSVDEANAALGLIYLPADCPVLAVIRRVQNDLFDCGADLCIRKARPLKLQITPQHTEFLEQQIDHFNQLLAPLNSFVLPGGTVASAQCHFARTVVRRAERLTCALAQQESVNSQVAIYLNRLSDLLFVLARTLNDNGKADILWQPGQSISTEDEKPVG